MVKIVTTLSIDSDIRNKAKEILKQKGITLSFYFEQFLRKLIKDYEENQKEVKNGTV